MNNHAIHYIIRFLLGEDISEEIVAAIGYTNNSKHYDRYSIVIIPSGFSPIIYMERHLRFRNYRFKK